MVRRLLDYQDLAEKWTTGSADENWPANVAMVLRLYSLYLLPPISNFSEGEPLWHTLQRWSESLHYTLEVLKISQASSRTARFIENHQVFSAHHHGVALKSSRAFPRWSGEPAWSGTNKPCWDYISTIAGDWRKRTSTVGLQQATFHGYSWQIILATQLVPSSSRKSLCQDAFFSWAIHGSKGVKVAHPGGTSPEIGSTHVLEIMRALGNGESMGELGQFIGISRDLRLSKHHPHHPQHPPHLHRNLHHPHPKQPPLWRLFSLHRVPRRGVFPLYRKWISSTKPCCQNEWVKLTCEWNTQAESQTCHVSAVFPTNSQFV